MLALLSVGVVDVRYCMVLVAGVDYCYCGCALVLFVVCVWCCCLFDVVSVRCHVSCLLLFRVTCCGWLMVLLVDVVVG